MKGWKSSLLLLPLFVLASCSIGPKYTRPSVPAAPAYKEQPPAQFQGSKDWQPATPSDEVIREKWWELFGDAQLNALEEQVTTANQNLKVAEARFRQARAMIRFNRADLFPTVGTSPNISSQRLSDRRPLNFGNSIGHFGDFVLPIDVSYELDVWGRVRKNIAAAREEFQGTAADVQTVRLSLHSELAINYFELRSLDAQKQLLDDTVAAFEKALQLTQNRFQGGVAAGAEVAQAQTQLEATRAQAIDVGVMRAQYEHAIAVLTGQQPEVFSLASEPLKANPPMIPTGIPSQLLERRPDIAGAERRVAVANEQVGLAKIAYYPTITLTGRFGFEGNTIDNWLEWPSRFWAVGPAALQTIFDGGRRRANSESALANYDGTVATYRQTVLDAFQQVEDNLAALRILADESKTQRAAVEAARRSLALSTNRYKGGLVTYLEVVTAQSTALTNERTEVDILRRRANASVLLIKALGGGWNVANLPNG